MPPPSAVRTWQFRWSDSTTCPLAGPADRAVRDRTAARGGGPVPGRARPTTIVAPPADKTFELPVQVPVPDMTNLTEHSIWPDVEERIVDLIEAHRSSIVFANSRRLAERLTSRLNEIYAERPVSNYRRRQPRWPPARPGHIMASGQSVRRATTAGQGAPRVGQQGAARAGRGRPQERAAAAPSSRRPAWNSASTWARWTW